MLNNEEKVALFLIEGGPMMDLVKKHLAERDRVHKVKLQILEYLALDPKEVEIWARRYDGMVTALRLPSREIPEGFNASNWTKPDNAGRRTPKKGTVEYEIFYAKECRYTPQTELIAKALKVPCSVGYKSKGGEGWTRIGRMLNECGFLWMHKKDGPFAMWIPDVPACVEEMKTRHKGLKDFKILGGADTWSMDMTGIKPILQEEWDLLVAQKNLEEAKAKAGVAA
jgi:hypothetical protein